MAPGGKAWDSLLGKHLPRPEPRLGGQTRFQVRPGNTKALEGGGEGAGRALSSGSGGGEQTTAHGQI